VQANAKVELPGPGSPIVAPPFSNEAGRVYFDGRTLSALVGGHRARSIALTLNPEVLDVPENAGLPDPWSAYALVDDEPVLVYDDRNELWVRTRLSNPDGNTVHEYCFPIALPSPKFDVRVDTYPTAVRAASCM